MIEVSASFARSSSARSSVAVASRLAKQRQAVSAAIQRYLTRPRPIASSFEMNLKLGCYFIDFEWSENKTFNCLPIWRCNFALRPGACRV